MQWQAEAIVPDPWDPNLAHALADDRTCRLARGAVVCVGWHSASHMAGAQAPQNVVIAGGEDRTPRFERRYGGGTMNTQTSALSANPASASAADWLRGAGIVLAGSLLVALCARVALPLPFTPVPLTLQPFAVLVLGMLLAPRLAATTLAAYLVEGAAGLPVFAPGAAGVSGLAHLLGPTGGYLLSYPIAAFAVAALWRASRRSFSWSLISAAAGNLIILSIGALWLSIYKHAFAGAVLTQAVIPFLPGDALKVIVAGTIGFQWNRLSSSRRPNHPTV
jgi:biotin transport system substrate-specific component